MESAYLCTPAALREAEYRQSAFGALGYKRERERERGGGGGLVHTMQSQAHMVSSIKHNTHPLHTHTHTHSINMDTPKDSKAASESKPVSMPF